MIVGIEGTVEKKEPTFVHLNLNGLIHEVNISLNTSNAISESRVKLLVTQIISYWGSGDNDNKRKKAKGTNPT
jgi:Holliday junction DNA helicase RuvA